MAADASADPLLRRPPAFAVFAQGFPLALGLASHAAINLVDLAMVGRLGGDAVQAAHVGSTWNFLPMIVGNCVSNALLARLSRALGSGDVHGARALNARGQSFMLWLAIAMGVATALPAVPMVDFMGVQGQVHDDAVRYLVVSNLGCVPMFMLMQTTAAMRAVGEAAMPLALLLGANVLNLLLLFPLLYGWPALGVPAVGVVGAAWAAVAARTVAALVAVGWLSRRAHVLTLRADATAVVARAPRVAWPLLVDALPQMLQIALRGSLVVLLTPMVRVLQGSAALVAFSITTRFDTVVLFSSLGFANAATAYAGRAIGRAQPQRARAAGRWAAAQAGALGALFVLTMIAAGPTLVAWCLPERPSAVVDAAVLYFSTASWSQVAGAAALGAIGAVQGAGSMRAPLVVDVAGFAVVYALLLGGWFGSASLAQLYWALVAGMVVVATFQVALVNWGRWADRSVPQ